MNKNYLQSSEYDETCRKCSDSNLETLYFKSVEMLIEMLCANGVVKRLMDTGAQQGQFCDFVTKKHNIESIAVDINPHSIEQGKKRFPSVHFETADFIELDGYDNKIDILTCFNWLFYADSNERKKVYEKMKRVLVNTGHIVIGYGDVNWRTHFDMSTEQVQAELKQSFNLSCVLQFQENKPFVPTAHEQFSMLERPYTLIVASK